MCYQVTTFSNSVAALEHFRNKKDAYDLVITDMTMPQMTGDVLTKNMLLIRPDIPVIMCTGFSEIIDEEKAKAMNIRALLYKPVIKDDLLQTIRGILDADKDGNEKNHHEEHEGQEKE